MQFIFWIAIDLWFIGDCVISILLNFHARSQSYCALDDIVGVHA